MGCILRTRAKSRGLKNVYYVKVAVFIDSSAWDFYVSAFKETNPFTKDRNTRRKIRKMFSHIFNGVNLLYKGIQDNDISINIILSRVSFFEKYTESPHFKSRPVLVNKTYYIDADVYLNDFQKWDDTVGKKLEPGFDHGMLITRYQLFQGDLASAEKDDRYIGGIAATGRVCVIGRRDSVVMIQAWNAMVISVAHEIGHSLGARHDGTYEASHCRAEEQFIMSATMENPNKTKEYSRNPWLFSHCSVTSFKNTLKQKEKKCVTIPGDYYDHNEYTQNVKDEAGEVYNANEQCEFIHGQGSYVCETRTADVCNFMRCFDPQIRICNKKYYVAARGTSCGSNLWCMEGLCLPKRK